MVCNRAAFALALLTCGTLAQPAVAQYLDWLRQIGTPVNERTNAAMSDGIGGVVIGGGTLGSLAATNAGADDAWMARYDGLGNALWVRQIGSNQMDFIVSLCLGTNGMIYVGGETFGALGIPQLMRDAWIASYDMSGKLNWLRQFGSGDVDYCRGLAPDATGGAYVGGKTWGWPFATENPSGLDGWLARYNAAGDLVWGRQFGTTTNVDLEEIAADGVGGVYAAGYCEGDYIQPSAGNRDAWVARYDASGNLMWERQFGTSQEDLVFALASDGAGGVFIGGHKHPTTFALHDVWFARYDSAGNQLWIRTMGTSLDDRMFDVEPDGAGGLFACGMTTGELVGHNNGGEDAWLARFDSQGYLVWGRQVGTTAIDRCVEVCRDLDGSAFFAGETNGSLGGQNVGARDAWVGRYGPACAADINGNSSVDVGDLLAVITTWGPCPNCPPNTNCAADIAPFITDGDCVIDVSDLLAVITTWGPCK